MAGELSFNGRTPATPEQIAALAAAIGAADIPAGKLVGGAAAQVKIDALRRTIAAAEASGRRILPALASELPVVTPGALNAASTINGAGVTAPSVPASDGRYFYAASAVVPSNQVNSGSASASRTASSVNYGGAVRVGNWLEVYLKTPEPIFEVGQRLFGATMNMWVDDRPISLTDFNCADGGGSGAANAYTKFDFTNAGGRKMRKIRLIMSGANDFTGINFGPSGTVVQYSPLENFKTMFFGDSWIEPTGAGYRSGGLGGSLARLMGIENYLNSGVGGTGIIQSNGSRPNWQNRIADITDYAPDFVFMPLSINDNGQLVNIPAAYAAFTSALQDALPNSVLFFTGPANPSANAPSDATAAAMLAAVNSVADPKRTFTIDTYNPSKPFSGTGAVGAPSGSGNQDFYMGGASGTDKAHLSPAGNNEYYPDFLFQRIKAKLLSLAT